jgi:hypothetical protein
VSTTLVMHEAVASIIEGACAESLETAGVILANWSKAPNGAVRLLARRARLVPENAYLERKHDRLSIASEGYVGALAEAEVLGAVPIWFHTHPGDHALPIPSDHDHRVDQSIADLFRLRSGSKYYGTLVVSPRPHGLTFTGNLQSEDGVTIPIDRLWRVGDDWRLLQSYSEDIAETDAIFSRSVRAFGTGIQHAIGALRCAIVGCGGTGSAVAEQLVRLGLRDLLLIDPDSLTPSNLTRVYGSTPQDVGRPKVAVLGEHLRAIAPGLKCEVIESTVTLETTARRLMDRDIVFGCTDDNAGRLVLSRLATFLLTPVIDLGVLLSSDAKDVLIGIDGRITTVAPGAACLVCRDRIDFARAAAELRTPEERRRLEDEGYAPALGRV